MGSMPSLAIVALKVSVAAVSANWMSGAKLKGLDRACRFGD